MTASRNLLSGSHKIEEVENRHAEALGDDIHGIQRGVCLPAFNAAQIGLIEAASLSKLDLAEASFKPALAHHCAEFLGKR